MVVFNNTDDNHWSSQFDLDASMLVMLQDIDLPNSYGYKMDHNKFKVGLESSASVLNVTERVIG